MLVGNYIFEYVDHVEPLRDARGSVLVLAPAPENRGHIGRGLHAYGSGPFCIFTIRGAPVQGGVYLIVVAEQPAYVGVCQNFSTCFNSHLGHIRYSACLQGGQQTFCRLNTLICRELLEGGRVSLWSFSAGEDRRAAIKKSLLKDAHTVFSWNLI